LRSTGSNHRLADCLPKRFESSWPARVLQRHRSLRRDDHQGFSAHGKRQIDTYSQPDSGRSCQKYQRQRSDRLASQGINNGRPRQQQQHTQRSPGQRGWSGRLDAYISDIADMNGPAVGDNLPGKYEDSLRFVEGWFGWHGSYLRVGKQSVRDHRATIAPVGFIENGAKRWTRISDFFKFSGEGEKVDLLLRSIPEKKGTRGSGENQDGEKAEGRKP
jgi:hypothetical protein